MKAFAVFAPFVSLAAAEVLWDGRFNDLDSATDLDNWSWSNQVGPYQYYIHGDGNVTEYVNLSADYANPADSGSSKGAKISLTDTAYWNGQTMRRTELIPQTSAAIAAGKVFYHFSIKRESENAPSLTREHQIAFFESHFTELKSGLLSGASGTEDKSLRWMVGGTSKWEVEWEAGVWHNMAYEIDFDGETVGLWHSTGADALKQVVEPVTASTSSNGADWHVGVLELANGDADATEDFYFSGVYIEDGDITTAFSGSSGDSTSNDGTSDATSSASGASATSSSAASPSTASSSASPSVTSSSAASPSIASSSAASASATIAPGTTTKASVVTPTLAKATTFVTQTSAGQTSVAQTSAAQATSAPVKSTPTLSSTSAVATPKQTSRCKLSRRSRQRRSL